MRCDFCDRRAAFDAFIPSSNGDWNVVCRYHFKSMGCSFKEGKAEMIPCTPPVFNVDADELLESTSIFNQEVQLNG
jgi:hypothetical protein